MRQRTDIFSSPGARLAAFVLLSGILAGGCSTTETAPTKSVEFLNQDLDVKYVGIEACRQCHFEKHTTYVHTGMGRSFYPMTPEEVVEDFTAASEFVVDAVGMHYRMEERDGKFYQRQFMVDSSGQEVAVDEHELVYVVGSNNHSRSYITVMDGKLFQAPACWYPDIQKWDLCPGYEFKNDHFGRETSASCLHCHNGKMKLVEGERNKFVEPFPHGIGCERCHGPGELHVNRWKSGQDTPSGGFDNTIVNPRRMPPQERIHVCFQCHLGDAKATERVMRHGRDFDNLRPGQPVTEVSVPFTYDYRTEYGYGLSSQGDRLILSACYKESGGKLDCLGCHNPHITVYHEDRPDDFFRQRCLSCHAVEACTASDDERQQTRPADDCVACHMRKAAADDQRFALFTDHWIRRDTSIGEPDHRERFDVVPVFPEHYETLPEGEQSYYHARALSLMARNAPIHRRPPMFEQAERLFQEAIEKGFDNADVWYFLGKVRRDNGKHDVAMEAYARAFEHDPTHHDAAFARGQSLVARRKLPEALAVFAAMLVRDPDDPMALAETARTLVESGDLEAALPYYDQAILQEPWNSELHMNRGMLMAAQGDFDEATREAETAVKLNPDSPKVWAFYEKVMRATNRPADAAEARRFVEFLREPRADPMDVTRPVVASGRGGGAEAGS